MVTIKIEGKVGSGKSLVRNIIVEALENADYSIIYNSSDERDSQGRQRETIQVEK